MSWFMTHGQRERSLVEVGKQLRIKWTIQTIKIWLPKRSKLDGLFECKHSTVHFQNRPLSTWLHLIAQLTRTRFLEWRLGPEQKLLRFWQAFSQLGSVLSWSKWYHRNRLDELIRLPPLACSVMDVEWGKTRVNSHVTRKGNAWKFVKTLHVKFFPFG